MAQVLSAIGYGNCAFAFLCDNLQHFDVVENYGSVRMAM